MTARLLCLLLCLSALRAAPADSSSFALLRSHGLQPRGEALLAWLEGALPPDGQTASSTIAQLGALRLAERDAAQRTLERHAWLMLPQLEAARNSRDAEVRARVARLLDPRLRAQQIRLLDAVLRAVAWLRPPGACAAVLRILPVLRSEGLRRSARACLWSVAGEQDREALEHATTLAEPEQAALAVAALGGCGPRALPCLRALTAHQEESLRLAAALALARLAPREALGPLVGLLQAGTAARRRQVRFALEQLTGQDLGFHALGSPESREAAVNRWRAWLEDSAAGAPLQALRRLEAPAAIGRYLLSSPSQGLLCLDRQGTELFSLDCAPYDAELQDDGSLVVAERSLGRVRVLTEDGELLRQIDGLSGPCDVSMLADAHLLVLENAAGRVVELDAMGEVVWQVDGLNNPYDADRLPNGNTLVADSGNGRLVEFDAEGSVVWQVEGLDFPNNVLRLDDGTTVLTTYTSGGVLRLDAEGGLLWQVDLDTTLFSLGVDGDIIFVADGATGKVFQLDADGQLLCPPQQLPRDFVDLFFAP